jgi:hypothetical protein
VSQRSLSEVAAVLCVAALAVTPAAMGKPKSPKPGGKKLIGEVVSFDAEGMILTVEMNDGSPYEGEVTEDVQVKLEHRGDHDRRGNPTNGTVEDIEEGAKVLRMKESKKTDLIVKIRLRPAPEEVCVVEEPQVEVPEVDAPAGEVETPEDPLDCPEEEVVDEGQTEGGE